MTSQKLPLFGGLIQPAAVGASPATEITTIFTPPDKDSKAPQTYELHVWLKCDGLVRALSVLAVDNLNGKVGGVWGGVSAVGNGSIPQKILDGFPVRGDVTIGFVASGVPADVYPHGLQLWGYYVPVGQGAVVEEARRPIGQALAKFGAGVPFLLSNVQPPVSPVPASAPTSAIVHVFSPGRVDDITLGFTAFGPAGCGARLTLEKADSTPVIAGHYIDFDALTPFGPGLPAFGSFPPSPYVIHKLPLGGHPDLHHLRVEATDLGEGSAGLGVHGFFTRH